MKHMQQHKHNLIMRLVVPSLVILISASPALAQVIFYRATITVPAGVAPDDAETVFSGTGGTIANVAWDAVNSTAPAPVAIVPNVPGAANGVNITWAANIAPGDIVAFTFSTTTPTAIIPITADFGTWTKGGVPIPGAPIVPADVTLEQPLEIIPAVSNLGLVVLLLLTAAAGVIVIRRSRRGHAAA